MIEREGVGEPVAVGVGDDRPVGALANAALVVLDELALAQIADLRVDDLGDAQGVAQPIRRLPHLGGHGCASIGHEHGVAGGQCCLQAEVVVHTAIAEREPLAELLAVQRRYPAFGVGARRREAVW